MFKKTGGMLLGLFAAFSLQSQAESSVIEVETQKYSIIVEGLKISTATHFISNPDGSITAIKPGFAARQENLFVPLVSQDKEDGSTDGFCKLIGKETSGALSWSRVLTQYGKTRDIRRGYFLDREGSLRFVEPAFVVESVQCK